jgi:hypothetical protein
MSGGMTVIGLTPGIFLIEDIRVSVPYQTAVQIPAHLVQRSRHLGEALHHQRIMKLGNALPLPAAATAPALPPLAPILRGRGIAPHNPVTTRAPVAPAWPQEREALLREMDASNEAFQAALTAMSSQLSQIQQTLANMKGGQVQEASPAGPRTRTASVEAEPAFDDSIPLFIPPTTQEAAEVRISLPESTSDSDLSGARGALRSLRKGGGP